MSEKLPGNAVIERAHSDDSDVLTELWIELASDQRQHGSHLRAERNGPQIHETMLQHIVSGTAFVARYGEEPGDEAVVGFVTFGTESGRYDQDCVRGIVHNIYVEERLRGRGIGSELLTAAESELESRGVDAIGLEAMADNDAAISFYRQRGYIDHRIQLEKPINNDHQDPSED